MSVYTDFDKNLGELKGSLEECLVKARDLVVKDDVWGREQVKDDYVMDIYLAIKEAIRRF